MSILFDTFLPFLKTHKAPHESRLSDTNLAVIGAILLSFIAVAYALSIGSDMESYTQDPKVSKDFKDMYREKRDKFRSNPKAMKELSEWKRKNDHYEYKILRSGLVSAERVGVEVGDSPLGSSDTNFSEYKAHYPSLILSESALSYIIGNRESYDTRQYPQWLNPKFQPGQTPEGQGFGHCMVIPKARVFNIVDPDATANNAALLKEMQAHFVSFWEHGGTSKLLESVHKAFDNQNGKLTSTDETDESRRLVAMLEADFKALAKDFTKLKPGDFEYGFHPFPKNSVGHLHMHVFPKKSSLRKFSTKRHDWKTIPLEAVLEVEKEDNERAGTASKT